MLDEIAMLMGGIAAEEVMLGSFSDGAGGLPGSDLVTATDLATILECQLGFTFTSEAGGGPVDLQAMRKLNPVAWRHTDETVRPQFERAEAVVQDLTSAVQTVANELLARKRLSGEGVRTMIASSPTPLPPE